MAEFIFKNLKSINKDTMSWKAKVTVLCVKPPKLAKNNTVRFQKLIFVDELGDCIDAVMYDGEIEKYKDIIKQDRTYIICNASLALADVNYKSVFSNNDYSWTIHKNTLVSDTSTTTMHGNPFRGHFTEHADLKIGSLISIIVVVINAQAPRKVPTGQTVIQYVVIDKFFNEIIISLWDDATTDHTHSILDSGGYLVIALINYNVKKYHDFSLSSSSSSYLITKMDNPAFTEMENWRISNKEKIESIIAKGHEQGLKFAVVSNKNLPGVNISQLLEAEPKKKYIITVKAGMDNSPTSFLYTCCNVCHTKTMTSCGEMFMCMGSRCKIHRLAVRRFLFTIQVEDSTGKIDVTLFGEIGQKMSKMNENDFHIKYDSDLIIPREDINSVLKDINWRMRIFKNASTYNGNVMVSYILDDIVGLNDDTSNEDTSTQAGFAAKEKASNISQQQVTPVDDLPSSVKLHEKETQPDVLLEKAFVTITNNTSIEKFHDVTSYVGPCSDTKVIEKGALNDIILKELLNTKKTRRHRGSENSSSHVELAEQGTSSDVVMEEVVVINPKKRGRPPGARNKASKCKTLNTSPEISYSNAQTADKAFKASTDLDKTQEETTTDVLPNEASVTVDNNTRKNLLDPNIKVKIEEVEDAKRDAAYRARTNPATWDENEIINVDLQVQFPVGTPIAKNNGKATSDNIIPQKRRRGRPRGSGKNSKTSQ